MDSHLFLSWVLPTVPAVLFFASWWSRKPPKSKPPEEVSATIFFVTFLTMAVMAMNGCASSPTPIATAEMPAPTPAPPTPTVAPPTPTQLPPTQTVAPPTPTQLPPTPTPVPQVRTLQVTSTADRGPGTLRQALLDAQNGDTITFDPAVFPPNAPETIAVTSGLPGISQGHLTIDASDAGVILDGSQLPGDSWIPGLEIVSDGNTIRGLQVINFTGTGIVVAFHGRNNTIGGDRNIGAGPIGQGNLCSGNDFGFGLWDFASNNAVTGNLIGTDVSGAQALGNHNYGVWITEGTRKNTIGPDNIIAYNGGPGVDVDDSETVHNTITRNSIHDNGRTGIHLWAGGNNELAAPIISDFDLQARTLAGASCANCTVEIFSDDNDEGAIYEGQTTADGTGVFTFNKGAPFMGSHLSATATDMDGNTSEFSIPTSGAIRSLVLQQGNNLPWTILQPKESKELEDNRISTLFSGFSYGEGYDIVLYSQGIKGARASINANEAVGVDWSMPELSIHPSHDDVFTRLADNGFVITYILTFWDKATYPDGAGAPCPRFKTEGEIQRYLEFVRFIVSHFKDRVQIYEIWNEPDNTDCPQWIKVEDYINLVQRVVPAIRQEYPEAKIQVGSTSGLSNPDSEAYLFSLLESSIMPLVDIVAWHPFYGNSPQYDAEYYYAYPSMVQEIKDVASAHGFNGGYQADEMGWRTPENSVPDDPWTYSSTVAAKYHGRGILMHLGMDVGVGIGLEYYYQMPSTVNVIRFLSTIMAGARPGSVPIQVQSTATNIVSYTFSLPNGDHLIALWTDGVAVDDDPGVNTTLTFPDTFAQRVIGIDVLHGFEQQLIVEQDGTNLVIRNLLVKDYPMILRLID
jgi:parallel beta-helix repeat protein